MTVLFNLLRMRVLASANKDKLKFKQDDVFYDDGHVAQSYKQFLGDSFSEEFDIEYNEGMNVVNYTDNLLLSAGDYCPNVYGFSQRDLNILCMAVAGWRCDYPVRIAASIGACATRFVLMPGSRLDNIYSIEQFNDKDVEIVLRKLISANRLQAEFDLAYALLVNVMFTPQPRAIEANAWVSPALPCTLPRASTFRGLLSDFTKGAPYQPRPTVLLTWENYKKNPNRIFIHGMAMCEAMFTGLFEVLTNKADNLESTLAELGITGAGEMTPYRVAFQLASLRFGQSFELRWPTEAGADVLRELLSAEQVKQRTIEVSEMGDTTGYVIYTRNVGGRTVKRVRANRVRPVMFPVLSYGINDNRYYVNSFKYEASVKYDQNLNAYGTNDNMVANKFLTALRIGGIDATAYDSYDGKIYKNWAANSNGQVMPDVPSHSLPSTYIFKAEAMTKRQMNWIDLPSQGCDLTLSVDIKPKSYVLYSKGRMIRTGIHAYTPVVDMPKPVASAPSASFVVQTQSDLKSYKYQDFLMAESDDPPGIPSESEPVATTVVQYTDMSAVTDGQPATEEPTEI